MTRRVLLAITILTFSFVYGCSPSKVDNPHSTATPSTAVKTIVGTWQWEKTIAIKIDSADLEVGSTTRMLMHLNSDLTGDIRTTVIPKNPAALAKLEDLIANDKIEEVPDIDALRPHDKTLTIRWRDLEGAQLVIDSTNTDDKFKFTYSISPSGNELIVVPIGTDNKSQTFIRASSSP